MIRGMGITLAISLVLAFCLGLLFPSTPEQPVSVARHINTATGATLRPGEGTVEAVRFLRTLRADPPPPAPPPQIIVLPPAPPPPPPPPDVSIVFKAALSAIRRDPDTGVYSAIIRNPAAPGPQLTSMMQGARFGDGWRVTEISATSVTLRKGRETRIVRLYG